jgi:hypothetical protein
LIIQNRARQRIATSKVALRRQEQANRQEQIKQENLRLKQANKNAIGKNDNALTEEVLGKYGVHR